MSKVLLRKLEEHIDSGHLLEIVDESLAVVQVLRKLGFSEKGQYVSIVREFLTLNDIDTSHFTPNGKPKTGFIEKECLCCGKLFKTEKRPSNQQVTCSRACSNTYFRSGINNGNFIDSPNNYRNKALKAYKPICNICGFSNIAALQVHHKDRNRLNNDISNLEILCANCHALEHSGDIAQLGEQ